MRYMLLIYSDELALDDAEREECYEESTRLAQDLESAGQFVSASPLQPTAAASCVRVRDGRPLVTSGPYAETREQLGGYFMIDVAGDAEAAAVAARIPMARKGAVEVRPVIELPGLPAAAAETRPAAAATTGDLELVISRVIDAPRELVFKAWTEPQQLSQWWGPHGMTTPLCEMDLRPGGAFRTLMRAADGTEYPNEGVFLEVAEPERLVFTDAYREGFRPAPESFMTAVITFEDHDGRTRLTGRALHRSAADRERHEQMGFHQGWGEMLERLDAHVAKTRRLPKRAAR